MFNINLHITGEFKQTEIEKTIMLVGATGSGKSTLVDGIVNYVMGVSFEDPFRFSLIQLEKEENKIHNQVLPSNNDNCFLGFFFISSLFLL